MKIKDAGLLKEITGNEKIPVSNGSDKPATITVNLILDKVQGTSSNNSLIEITYEELKQLRDSGLLVPGLQYRMIDYETIIKDSIIALQSNISASYRSAGNLFDLILTADTNDLLKDECQAVQSVRDVNGYFSNSDLASLKYPEAIIILIDDDMLYLHNFIEECVKAYEQNPKVIQACRVHKILYENEHILSYKKWEWDSKETHHSFDLFFTGCDGVVLFPGSITNDDIHLSEIYKYITVDDILLNTIVKRKRIKVLKINTVHKPQPINILHNKFNLSFDNLKYKNDEALRDICFENILNKLI